MDDKNKAASCRLESKRWLTVIDKHISVRKSGAFNGDIFALANDMCGIEFRYRDIYLPQEKGAPLCQAMGEINAVIESANKFRTRMGKLHTTQCRHLNETIESRAIFDRREKQNELRNLTKEQDNFQQHEKKL